MTRRLFLTGPSGCGKSTLLRAALQGRLAAAGGFITERQRNADGSYAYFYLQRADGTGSREIFLDLRQLPPKKSDLPFTGTAVQLLREEAPFFLLDEIGGMELLLPEFQAALDSFLDTALPCIGVLKSIRNSRALQTAAALPEAYLQAAEQLRNRLEQSPDTTVLEMSDFHDLAVEAAVTQWVEEYAHGFYTV